MKKEIDKLLSIAKSKMPSALYELNNGVTTEELQKFEKLIDYKLPKYFIETYAYCNGFTAQTPRLFNGLTLLHLNEIITHWQGNKQLLAEGTFAKDNTLLQADADAKIKKDWWHNAWLPIMHNGSGDYILIDLAPDIDSNYGQIIEYWHDSSYRNVLATSLQNYFIKTTAEIENEDLIYNADYNSFTNFG